MLDNTQAKIVNDRRWFRECAFDNRLDYRQRFFERIGLRAYSRYEREHYKQVMAFRTFGRYPYHTRHYRLSECRHCWAFDFEMRWTGYGETPRAAYDRALQIARWLALPEDRRRDLAYRYGKPAGAPDLPIAADCDPYADLFAMAADPLFEGDCAAW